jgi:hypothetical protein
MQEVNETKKNEMKRNEEKEIEKKKKTKSLNTNQQRHCPTVQSRTLHRGPLADSDKWLWPEEIPKKELGRNIVHFFGDFASHAFHQGF